MDNAINTTKQMRKLIILTFISILPQVFFGQSFKEFSSQSDFLEELKKEIVEKSVGDARKEHKNMLDKFEEMWTELNAFTPTEKSKIFTTSNKILDARLKMIPDIRDYIEAIIIIKESESGANKLNEWHVILDVVLEGRSARKEFGTFLNFSSKLYSNNTIFHSASTEWVSDNSNYRFEIEDGNPKLIVPSLNLKCLSKNSEIEIKNTSGVYYPLDEKWVGKNGTVTWERAGLDPNRVYAVINDYDILMKFSKYNADSVTFYNVDYFPDPLSGRLEDAVRANVTKENSSFPSFASYSKRLKIANIDKNVDYEGGFTQRGARFIASGSKEDPAYLLFYLNDKQKQIAEKITKEENNKLSEKVVTKISLIKNYCPAEEYHQKYLEKR